MEVDAICDLPLAEDEKSLNELFAPGPVDANKVAFYVGYTGRMINQEWVGWLSKRGAGGDGGVYDDRRNRPVLLRPSGQVITPAQAKDELKFSAKEVFADRLKVNARKVEAALQRRFQYLPLGVRLWRGRAAFVERLQVCHASDLPRLHLQFLLLSSPRTRPRLQVR